MALFQPTSEAFHLAAESAIVGRAKVEGADDRVGLEVHSALGIALVHEHAFGEDAMTEDRPLALEDDQVDVTAPGRPFEPGGHLRQGIEVIASGVPALHENDTDVEITLGTVFATRDGPKQVTRRDLGMRLESACDGARNAAQVLWHRTAPWWERSELGHALSLSQRGLRRPPGRR